MLKKLAFLFIFFPFVSHAEQNCQSRRETETSTEKILNLKGKTSQYNREIVLSCTAKDDVVQVSLRDSKTKKVLQSLLEHQYRFYLDATLYDLDLDGFQDLILPLALGNPSTEFKVWRFDPRSDKLVFLFAEIGLDFYRSKYGDVVIYSKTGLDNWSKKIFFVSGKQLKQKYEIVIPNSVVPMPEGSVVGDCAYYRIGSKQKLTGSGIPQELKRYCNLDISSEIAVNFFK